ncbi:DUF6388 family protein [Delftia sp. PS-11]|uniref:DUF6388 family protein n=1 Tax=Delftia sp. PS-11 TaxID=2767222 RepID=UPI002454A41C|nr:DUF6388 family protein [Delftia sp. PS-11]KAJ8745461.1 hypothetical protein H9T68_06590 [Delftia sp. PS-11]
MSKPLLSKDQVDLGIQRFLDEDPQARTRVENVSQEVADALGVELSELRSLQAREALGVRAAEQGTEPFEYLLKFTDLTDAERLQVLRERDESLARALGLQ